MNAFLNGRHLTMIAEFWNRMIFGKRHFFITQRLETTHMGTCDVVLEIRKCFPWFRLNTVPITARRYAEEETERLAKRRLDCRLRETGWLVIFIESVISLLSRAPPHVCLYWQQGGSPDYSERQDGVHVTQERHIMQSWAAFVLGICSPAQSCICCVVLAETWISATIDLSRHPVDTTCFSHSRTVSCCIDLQQSTRL